MFFSFGGGVIMTSYSLKVPLLSLKNRVTTLFTIAPHTTVDIGRLRCRQADRQMRSSRKCRPNLTRPILQSVFVFSSFSSSDPNERHQKHGALLPLVFCAFFQPGHLTGHNARASLPGSRSASLRPRSRRRLGLLTVSFHPSQSDLLENRYTSPLSVIRPKLVYVVNPKTQHDTLSDCQSHLSRKIRFRPDHCISPPAKMCTQSAWQGRACLLLDLSRRTLTQPPRPFFRI